jgi:hypothetical protein
MIFYTESLLLTLYDLTQTINKYNYSASLSITSQKWTAESTFTNIDDLVTATPPSIF